MPEPTAPFGFLVIDKPRGLTSHDVVAGVRRGAHIKRVGHAGTLDPLATGLLIVCIGAATRLSEYVMASQKAYRAQVRLGIETDSYDAEGQIVADASEAARLSPESIQAALARFQGEQDQIPPMYSAIKRGGKKLYELARQGQTLDLEPRRVWMQVELLRAELPDVELHITCSAGTYIRSLAHDLGAALGVGGHLAALRRVRSGALDESAAVAWDTLQTAFRDDDWARFLIDEARALPSLPALHLSGSEADDVLHGRPLAARDTSDSAGVAGIYRAYGPDGQFLAVLAAREGRLWPEKVFSSADRVE